MANLQYAGTYALPACNVVVTATYKAVEPPVHPEPQPEDKGWT